jgi:pseudaminic acid synthase
MNRFTKGGCAATTIAIAGRTIGPQHPPYVIAEMSANHGGDFDRACRIVELAAQSGADAIKFQAYTADSLTLDSGAPGFVVTADNPWKGRRLHELYAQAATPYDWLPKLFDLARSRGITPFCSPFDHEAVRILEGLNAPAYKIASFEAVDPDLIAACAKTGKPLIISTGMCSEDEIEEALVAARAAGATELAILKCTSAYPSQPSEANLMTIPAMIDRFQIPVGFSDHTLGAAVPATAVALGAMLIEKHFIDSREPATADSTFSALPSEMRETVRNCRIAFEARGSVHYGPAERERESLVFRRSLFVVRDVAAGEPFTRDNIRSVRPATGLAPKHFSRVLGRHARAALKQGTPLSWADVEGRPWDTLATSRLREAAVNEGDARLIMKWRNDPTTRSVSFNQELKHWPQFWDEYRRNYFHAGLPGPQILVAADEPLAFVGFERPKQAHHNDGSTIEITINVNPDVRERGHGLRALTEVESLLANLGYRRIVALVKPNNAASVRLFHRAKYVRVDIGPLHSSVASEDIITFIRHIVQPPPSVLVDALAAEIRLEPFLPEHVSDEYVRWLNDSEITRFTESRFIKHSYSTARADVVAATRDPSTRLWRIIYGAQGHIGTIRLAKIEPLHRRASTALIIGVRESWGRGIGTAAIRLMSRFGFSQLGLRRITATVYATNGRALKAFERAGYSVDAVLPQHFFDSGEFVDGIIMTALNPALPVTDNLDLPVMVPPQ